MKNKLDNKIKKSLLLIDKIQKIKGIKKQIIAVDDGSTDGSDKILKEIYKNKFHKLNK